MTVGKHPCVPHRLGESAQDSGELGGRGQDVLTAGWLPVACVVDGGAHGVPHGIGRDGVDVHARDGLCDVLSGHVRRGAVAGEEPQPRPAGLRLQGQRGVKGQV